MKRCLNFLALKNFFPTKYILKTFKNILKRNQYTTIQYIVNYKFHEEIFGTNRCNFIVVFHKKVAELLFEFSAPFVSCMLNNITRTVV